MNREQLFRFFFLAVLLFIIYQVLHILSPFYTGILGAIVMTLIFYPMHIAVLKKIGQQRTNSAAAISTVLVTLLTVFPFLIFSWLLFNEVTHLLPHIERLSVTLNGWEQSPVQWASLDKLKPLFHSILQIIQVDVGEAVTSVAGGMAKIAFELTKKIPKHAFVFFINMSVMIFTLFFLFRDGQTIFRRAKDLVPMNDKYKDNIAHQIYLTLTAVVRGVFTVAITQGTLAGIGFLAAGVPSPVLLAFSTMFVALIPLFGATLIWLPIALFYLFQGFAGKGIFLLLWGTLVISLVDNFLRPVLIGSRAKLPILFLFFGILGGIKVYGPMGLFLGPLIIAMLLAFVKIYREEYPNHAKEKDSEKSA